jgi:predicted nucleic acid-binding protein
MPGVVSDSSTLIHLSALGRLMLLQRFYEQVLIPPAVWRETAMPMLSATTGDPILTDMVRIRLQIVRMWSRSVASGGV